MAYPLSNPTNDVQAASSMENISKSLGYDPIAAGLSERGAVMAIVSNLLQQSPAVKVWTAAFDPASVAANITAEQDVTVTGVLSTDILLAVNPPTALNAGLFIGAGRVKAADTITVRLGNCTAGALDAASGSWKFVTVAASV